MSLCSICTGAICVPAGKGRQFPWKSDNAFVKVSSQMSSGAFSLIEDNITNEFRLPMHYHNKHSETFYVVSGKIEFQLADRTEVLGPGDTLHVPRDTHHAVRGLENCKLLTLYEPGGLEHLFERFEQMDVSDFQDEEKMIAIEAEYDSIRVRN